MYRAAIQPARAFGQTFGGFMSRLRALDQRSRWNSATVYTFPDDVSLTETVQSLVAQLPVDPGRWLFFAGANFVHTEDYIYDYLVDIELSGGPLSAEASRRGTGLGLADPTMSSLRTSSAVTITAPTTAQLRARWDVIGGSGSSCTATDVYIIAAPA